MEAVGAAGAIVGLAGSALTGLKSLCEFIAVLQDGKIDLDTTRQRLVEHEFRLSELKTQYDSLPTGLIIPEERILLDECIKGSHEEVIRYKTLLEKAAKPRAQRKSLKKVETAVRIYLHGEDFKKHRSLLQDRTLRLQMFSEKLNTVRTSESIQSIMSSTAQHHAEDMSAHIQTANTLQAVSEDLGKSIQESLNTSLAAEAHVTAVVGNYHQQTQTLIQASHLSTVQEINESMRDNILPIIRGLLDEAQNSDRELSRSHRRGPCSPYQGHNRLYAYEPGDVRGMIPNVYWTPLGWLHVSYRSRNIAAESCNAGETGATYRIKFHPYNLFSRNFVEWRLFLNTGCSGPPTTVCCNIGALCEDPEVIDALGLIPVYCNCSHGPTTADGCMRQTHTCKIEAWRTKTPDSRKLRRLLDERRVSPSDFIRSTYGAIEKILTVFVRCHKFCEQPQQQLESQRVYFLPISCFCEADQLIAKGHSDLIEPSMTDYITQKSRVEHEYLSQFYPAYYETLKLLLEVGCEPDDWDSLVSDITRRTFHVMESHTPTALFSLHPPIQLVRMKAGRSLVTEWYRPEVFKAVPGKLHSSGSFAWWNGTASIGTQIGNLLPHETLFHELEETIFDMGGAISLNEGFQCDRWLLVLMSYMQPRLKTLVASDDGTCEKSIPWDFSIERVIKEIANADEYDKASVAEYLGFNGNLGLIQLVIQKGFDPSMLFGPAVRRGRPEILDFVLHSYLKQDAWSGSLDFLHHPYAKQRITQDSVFRTQLLDFLVSKAPHGSYQFHNFDEALFTPGDDAFLVSDMTIGYLMLTGPPAVSLDYIREVADGCIVRYSEENVCFMGGIRLYLLRGLRIQHNFQTYHYKNHAACEDLGRPTSAYHQILQQLLSSSAFGCGLEHVPNDKPYSQESDIEDYTPLMLALHGGMIPAVKMLVEAGAAITKCAPYRRSALQLAEYNVQGKHPRVCWTEFYRWDPGRIQPQYISLSADREMLQLLQDALRSRGEEAPDPCSSKQDFAKTMPPLVFKKFWKLMERIEIFSYWLFSPTVQISMEDVGERLSYIAVVYTITFLSIAQLLRLKINGHVSGGLLRLLSRPVVVIPVAAWIIRALWRQYFVEPKGIGALPG